MKNRSIILTAILSFLGCGGLSYTALAGPPPMPVDVVNTPNVIVGNTTPIPVTGTVGVAENPARSAVQEEASGVLPGGQTDGTFKITVPAGIIFVIEFASISADTPGTTLKTVQIFVSGKHLDGTGNNVFYNLTIPPSTTTDFTAGGQALRLYAPGPQVINIDFELTAPASNSGAILDVSLSGYSVSAP